MIDTTFIDSLLNRKDDLFHKIYGFNVNIAHYIHPSFVQSHCPELEPVWHNLLENPRTRSRLSDFFSETFELNQNPYYDFLEPRKRLALLDANTLHDLMTIAGVTLYHESISKIITKKELSSLKDTLGPNRYLFATKRASLLKKDSPSHIPLDGGSITVEKILNAGKHCVETSFTGDEDPLLHRFILKFPKSTKWNFRSDITQAQKTNTWTFLHKLLLKEIQPSLAPCFT